MTYLIEGESGTWETVIGLEVHAQVVSKSKLFSGASTEFGAEPNTQVSPVDAGMPGMLPVINGFCVEQAVRTGLGLRAKINLTSVFARKNYFYPDLPPGYQISQYESPIVGEGVVLLDLPDGATRTIGIERLHLEQDAGKSLHDQHPTKSFIDLNRAGVALMEIVSRPDLRSPEEAGQYVTKLRSILRYLGTCDGNMQEGSLRCDANVSVRKQGEAGYRTRCEIKNVNSIRFLKQAIDFEAHRQVEIYEEGGSIRQETRLYDSHKGETRPMRSKEQAHDYRYFPDPDLLPLRLTPDYVEGIKATLPELPDEKKARFMKLDSRLTPYDASVLVADKEYADNWERTYELTKSKDAKLTANVFIGDVLSFVNSHGIGVLNTSLTPAISGQIIDYVANNTLSRNAAKQVFAYRVDHPDVLPDAIINQLNLIQVTDTGAIDKAIDAVMSANADKLAEYRSGKEKLFGFFVGQTMKAMGGKGNPALVNELLKKKLAG